MTGIGISGLSPSTFDVLTSCGLSQGNVAFMAEAAIACFSTCSIQSGLILTVDGYVSAAMPISWTGPANLQLILDSYNDLQEATEYGATALALMLVVNHLKMVVIKRSPKDNGGFDYYIGPNKTVLFQGMSRLEVAGTLHGGDTEISTRMNRKVKQLSKSAASGQPGYAVVVGFQQRSVKVQQA